MITTFTRSIGKKLFLLSITSLYCVSIALAQTPLITSISPVSGPVGTTVTITGTNFKTTASNNVVFLGATRAGISAVSETSLTVTVPVGATYKNFSVTDISRGLTAYSSKPFNVTYASGSVTFQPKQNFIAGNNPRVLASADLDGDGKIDLIVPNTSGSSVSILRNTTIAGFAVNSFAEKIDIPTASSTLSIVVTDFDGDGKPDLAVSSSGSVSVFRNTSSPGSIFFGSKQDIASADYVAFGDQNGDGKPDLATTGIQSQRVFIVRNISTTGTIKFDAVLEFKRLSNNSFPRGIAICDIDGDGQPEIAVADRSVKVMLILQVDNSLKFTNQVNFPANNASWDIATGDLDGDGQPDVAVLDNDAATIGVFRNTSTLGQITAASFSARVDFNVASSPYRMSIADIDGDGKPDLTTSSYPDGICVLRNASVSG